jgi:glycosyltransferase involved in cell wall biosynthesis
MSLSIHKDYVGQVISWPGKVCFIVLSSGLGGTETLAIRQSRWMRRNNITTAIITRAGVMNAEYGEAFDYVYILDDNEVDPGSLLMDEWYRLLNRLADGLRSSGGWHFLVFGQDGLFLASELSTRLPGSACSIYLIDDVRYGPARLEHVESMSRHGLFLSMNEACLTAHRVNYGYDLENAVVIPLPITVAPDARAIRSSARICVVTVARLVPMKGYVEGLISAIAVAVREEQLDVELRVIGSGPLILRLKWMAFRYGISDRVTFTGAVSYSNLPAIYGTADIFVGMGTTVLEAASHGVPVIIAEAYTKQFRTPGLFSRQGGYELGEPSVTEVSPMGYSLLVSLLKDSSLRATEGEAGKSRVLGQFSEDHIMTRFVGHLRNNARPVINIPSPGQDLLCGETKRYLKRIFRGSEKAASLRRRCRAVWDAWKTIVS